MRKITFLMALVVSFLMTAMAADFVPVSGAKYLIRCAKNNRFALHNVNCVASATDNTCVLSHWDSFDARSFFVIEGNTTDGFTIRMANNNSNYVYAINTNDANSNVGVKNIEDGATVPEDCLWKITAQGSGWNIIPKAGSRGWNCRGEYGGNTHIGQWGSNNTLDNTWYILDPSDFVEQQVASSWNAYTVASVASAKTALSNAAAAIEATDGFTDENISAYKQLFFATPAGAVYNSVPVSASGLYKIKNVQTSTYFFQEPNEKNVTFLNDGGDNNKYYWKVTMNNNNATIVGSYGMIPMRGGLSQTYENVEAVDCSPIALLTTDDPTKFLVRNMHTTNQTYYTKTGGNYNSESNPLFLTTWDEASNNNCYVFEAVNLAEDQAVYTVHFTNVPEGVTPTLTCNVAGLEGNVTIGENGFFVLSSPTAADFTALAVEDYTAMITIADGQITVDYYNPAQTLERLQTVITTAEANIAKWKNAVGYPTVEKQEAFAAAIAAAKAYTVDDIVYGADTKLQALNDDFMTTTDVILPTNGKAYTFTNVQKDGSKTYLQYTTDGMVMSTTESDATAFVCRKFTDGRYLFVNNDGKYLVWKGNANGKGANSNKGYIEDFDGAYQGNTGIETTQSDWGYLSVARMTKTGFTEGENADYFGYVTISGRRYAEKDDKGLFIIKASNNAFDNTDAAYYNSSFSSAFILTEVSYANEPNMNAATDFSGDAMNLATFSAPFATIVPEGVTAYYAAQEPNKDNVITMTAIDAAEAIPANTGVILSSTTTATTALMVPAATETEATVEGNKLQHSAGAEKAIEADVNAYILGSKNGAVAFYKLNDTDRTLAMNKSYLVLATSAAAIQMNFGGDTTGIEGVETAVDLNAPAYDLSGRRVMNPAKGLYIIGGKKVFIQ